MRLVVVSGASRGLGLGFARQLLRRAPQSTIVAASRSGTSEGLDELMAEWPGRIVPMSCDVTDQSSTRELGEQIKAFIVGGGGTGGGSGHQVDLLLNVAGVLHGGGGGGQFTAAHDQSQRRLPLSYQPERSLASVDATTMQSVFATNAIGAVLVTQAVAPLLAKGAVIANLSARTGSIGDNQLGGWWAYRMSKAALNMATKNTAIELRRRGVYAVALHPGTCDTEMSVPFKKSVPPGKLFTVEHSTSALLDVLDRLTPEDSGAFLDYAGARVEF